MGLIAMWKRHRAEVHRGYRVHAECRLREKVKAERLARDMPAIQERFERFRLPEDELESLSEDSKEDQDERFETLANIAFVASQCRQSPMDDIRRPDGNWHCGLTTLKLRPLYGSYHPTIVVSHNCEVTGERGHTTILRQEA